MRKDPKAVKIPDVILLSIRKIWNRWGRCHCLFSLLFFYLFCANVSIANSQDVPKFDVDYARFMASGGWTMVEIYVSFPRDMLVHQPTTNGYQAEYAFSVKLFSGDSLIKTSAWQKKDNVDSTASLSAEQQIMDIYKLYLQQGRYHLQAELRDLNDNSVRAYEKDMDIRSFSSQKLKLSDIQLAFQIRPARKKTQFVKNGYSVIPNPASWYGKNHPVIYYYLEIYNLSPLELNRDSTYTVKTRVLDINNQVVRNSSIKTRKRKASSLVEIGRVKLESLFSATYQLAVTVIDNATGDSLTQKKHFLFYQPGNIVRKDMDSPKHDEEMDEFLNMSEEELDQQFKIVRYIALREEKDIYDNLDLAGKRTFLAQFWKRRDPDKSTAINEFRKQYLLRIETANARFSSGSKEGWRTDQGRIWITYGEPDKIERSIASIGEKESETWYYFGQQGGIEFIFVDVMGFGELRLVHSTARDELQDFNWRDRWYK